MSKSVHVNNKRQKNYNYVLEKPAGKEFDADFKPELTPKEMLDLGIFGGNYFDGDTDEFPDEWFADAELSPGETRAELNFFGVNASQSLQEWQKKGWIFEEDPHGWVQWYFRYCMGRRVPEMDEVQIKRWKQIRRHIGQIEKNCQPGDLACRPRQRQALLHWAYDSRKI